MKTRIERDCLGEMEIDDASYFGIQTHRMMKVSGAAGYPVIAYPDMHRALFQIKKACAKANAEVGAMSEEVAEAIVKACDQLLAGGYDKQSEYDEWLEACAGKVKALILIGQTKEKIQAQSTNDTIPSATHLAIAPRLDLIIERLQALQKSFESKAEEFKDVVKVGRTCWQDALPLTLGQEFRGFGSLIKRLVAKLQVLRPGCFELIMGGSAVGTGLGASSGYMDAFYRHISRDLHEEVRPQENIFDGFQNADFFVTVSGAIKEVATSLSKISKDLRLMSSGPRAGFMEITLPALSPGSSIMPGKINPTVPEMVIQIAHQVVGNDVAIAMAYDEGELDLNVWDATFYKCLFENLQLVGEEILIFKRDCVDGITANRERCQFEAQSSLAISTVVAATQGYPLGVKVAHYAEQRGLTIKEAVLEMGVMTKEEADVLLDPMLLVDPEKMAQAIAAWRVGKR